jgi:nicotinamide-nucleotide amidase
MRIEVLCTGNELLDGTVLDTNATWFCERAFARGAPVSRKETLPDDLPVLVEAFRQMGERADFVVVSGGLGPTIDDITLDAAAQAAGVPLEEDVAILARLKQRFAERGFVFTPNNARQARVPRGGTAVHNPHGTAPMMILKVGRADCFLLPGVPREFRGLCDEQVIPRLEARLAAETGRAHYASRVLKLFGIGESMADDRVKDLPVRHPHVQVGFRTHLPENHLKLLAQGATDEEARARLAAAEADARALVGEKIFGVDHDEFPAVVFRALKAAGATVALAESCTGGLVASMLASVPGASEAMVMSAVVYQERAKTILLGVDADLVRTEGAVSAKVTRALAEAARARSGATFGVAVTGWAGPGGGTERDPVGTVCLCLSDARGVVEVRHRFPFERDRVRLLAAYHALDLVRRRLLGATT